MRKARAIRRNATSLLVMDESMHARHSHRVPGGEPAAGSCPASDGLTLLCGHTQANIKMELLKAIQEEQQKTVVKKVSAHVFHPYVTRCCLFNHFTLCMRGELPSV
jgi:hypothetical protein